MTLQENKEKSVRDHLIDEIEKSVVGPYGGDEEVIPSIISPIGMYWSGLLNPEQILDSVKSNNIDNIKNVHKINSKDTSEHNIVDDPDENNLLSESISNAGFKLSSFGLTCSIKESVQKIKLNISYGKYTKTQIKENSKEVTRYKRKPFSSEQLIDLIDGVDKKIVINKDEMIYVQYSVRKFDKCFRFTVFLLNKMKYYNENEDIAVKCIFQPMIELSSIENNERIFIDTSDEFDKVDKDDNDSMLFGLLFNSRKKFAIGHSCSVEWDVNDTKDNSVTWIKSTFLPKYEVPVIEPIEIDLDCLYMKNLSEIKNFEEFDTILTPLVEKYEEWISTNLKDNMDKIPKGFENIAKEQIKKCEDSVQRIKNGIQIISQNKKASEAFVFANRAMYLQRAHGSWAKRNQNNNGKVNGLGPSIEDCENIKWRIFQLAFILLNIESITNPKSKDRSIADVLWFATGGGKTEAYLGLIAFTLAYRRLRDSDSNDDIERYGVAVIMRYTLRLLTLQQFQRAALLMCACESIRRSEYDPKTQIPKWGDEPFYVGLWIGPSTPNTHLGDQGSINAIRAVRNGNKITTHNPIQLLSCPWCGSTLNSYNYKVTGKINQCRINCSNNKCIFESNNDDESLPVLVVDEDIYSRCPSLIIGTVDKFAQVSRVEKTASIFGYVDRYCPKHGFVITSFMDNGCNHQGKDKSFPLPNRLCPPELIIQDELHLISGPLGTVTGIYETVVDTLCTTSNGILPKIIASTATTKKSNDQIKKLFDRNDSRIFPPQGFHFGDTFFSREVPISEKRGKIYLGVCATSRSGIVVQGKIAASILRKVRYLYENKEKYNFTNDDLDQFYTLVAYFNVIKELGNASKLYDDTVPSFIDSIYRTFEKNNDSDDNKKHKDHRKNPLSTEELTSRKSSDQIPNILKKIEVKLQKNNVPLDVLLCTNMISVGIDIARLGVMIINGQPKNHSEYIQASGRIGREFPGLIVTNYVFMKPKDLSHFENFILYHSTFHKNVEPASLTPFSSRARDRALNGVIIALIRILEKRLAKNNNAQDFDIQEKWIGKIIKQIRDNIENRVKSIDKLELEGTLKDFDNFVNHWNVYAKEHTSLRYKENTYEKARKHENNYYLMRSDYNSSEDSFEDSVFVPNSLRDVEELAKLQYFEDDSIGGRDADE